MQQWMEGHKCEMNTRASSESFEASIADQSCVMSKELIDIATEPRPLQIAAMPIRSYALLVMVKSGGCRRWEGQMTQAGLL